MNDRIKLTINPQRQQGYLPPVKNKDIPKRLLFFDTETELVKINDKVSEHRLKLGVAIYVELRKDMSLYKRKVYRFTTTSEFIDILKNYDHKKKKLVCFAHNVKFDLMVLDLPYELSILGYDNNYPIVNGMTFIWSCRLEQGKFVFLDTANYAGFSLAKIGDDLGLPKLEVDFDNVTDEKLYEYCENDVMICETFMIELLKFIYSNNLGCFRMTLASQAFSVYRYAFMDKQPYITLRPDILQIERNAYYGGRTEAHYIGKIPEDKVYYIDINSAYPYAMTKPVPVEPLYPVRTNPTFEGFKWAVENSYVIADVKLDTMINAFPYRYDGKLMFPIGTFRTTLHQCELEYAIKHDLITEVYSYCAYRQDTIFDRYVDFFYDLKERSTIDNNGTLRMIAKLFMNSLYGKYGQVWKHTEKLGETGDFSCYILNNRDRSNGKDYIEMAWYGTIYKSWSNGEDKYSIPSISGAITAIGRMLLWDYMNIVGIENVYYVDTDSIMTNKQGYDKIQAYIHKTKLGMLDLEDIAETVIIHGAKDYQFNSTRKIKGVPKSAIETMTNVFQFQRFEGFKEWRNRGGKGSPRMIDTHRQRKNPYSKGYYKGDGIVKPLVFVDDKEVTKEYYEKSAVVSV